MTRLSQESVDKLARLHTDEIAVVERDNLEKFWVELGFAEGFNSDLSTRVEYAEKMISNISNGTDYMEKFLKKLFNPRRFRGDFNRLDRILSETNAYLVFDGVKVERDGQQILYSLANELDVERYASGRGVSKFIPAELDTISIENLGLDQPLAEVIENRIDEIKRCYDVKANLSIIFLAGSTLEGILHGIARMRPREFNQATSAPKKEDGEVKRFQEWSLNNFIDVAHELGLINEDVKRYSHSLREFRNYIHPYQQVVEDCLPTGNTADMTCVTLKVAIEQIVSWLERSCEGLEPC